jgi:hypothetical protein
MPVFGKRIDGLTGRRRTPREDVVLAGSARSLRASRPVVIADVSPLGAKLQGRELNSLEGEVLISVGNIDVFARIAWAEKAECGVIFEEDLSPQLVSHLKREGRWAKVMGLAAD